jgi:CHASE3 domain sensor protein
MEKNSNQNPEARLMALRAALVEAESSVRGFVITGQENVLADFKRDLPQVHSIYAALQDKVGEKARAEEVRQLKLLLDRRISHLQTTVDVRRASPAMDLQRHMTLVHMGTTAMRAFDRAADQLVRGFNTDRLLLRGRVEHAFQILWISGITAMCGVVLLSVLGCAGAYGFNAHALKKRNEVLQRLLKEAQNATVLKSAFLANISHEIRTSVAAASSGYHNRMCRAHVASVLVLTLLVPA